MRTTSPSHRILSARSLPFVALLATTIIALSNSAEASTVAQVQLQASGTAATLDQNPVVSAILSTPNPTNGLTLTRWIFLVNDGTGSMDIFNTAPLPGGYTPTVGDALTISGTDSPFSGIPELGTLAAINKLSSGNAVPSPLIETIPLLAGFTTAPPAGSPYPAFAGNLVTINNVTVSGATGNFGITNIPLTITDGATNHMAMFYNPTTYSLANANLFGTAVPTDPVNVSGIIQLFSGAPELIVTSITPVPEPSSLVLGGLGLIGLIGLARRRK